MDKFEPVIFNELKKYIDEDILRLDVPGHKGSYLDNEFVEYFGENIIKADVNSMERLDNLNYSSGIIKESQLNIAKLHKAKDSRYLINGTTLGIQTMVMASVKEKEYILVPKNIHKSVQSSLILSGAIPVYLDVEYDKKLGIHTTLTLDEVKSKVEKFPNIKACILINPSYYGISFEFSEIVKYLKANNIIVLVDEAHGGTFYFQNKSMNAMECGADMSSISYHKTLGTLTQTSLLLFNSDIVDINDVDRAFTMLTTTSPSYLFMANLEVSILDLFYNKKDLFNATIDNLNNFKTKLLAIPGLIVLDNEYFKMDNKYFDDLRLVVSVENLSISGYETYEILRDKYDIQIELGEINVILCIVSIFDDFNKLNRLYDALQEIFSKHLKEDEVLNLPYIPDVKQKSFISPREIFYADSILVNYKESVGKTIAESLMLYPPGIPLIMQGEVVTHELKDYIEYLIAEHEHIYGLYENEIKVLK